MKVKWVKATNVVIINKLIKDGYLLFSAKRENGEDEPTLVFIKDEGKEK